MDIKVHKNDLPEDLELGNKIAIDCEFMGLNFNRDNLEGELSIGNSGEGELVWSISENIAWLSVYPAQGTTQSEEDNITITINPNNASSGVMPINVHPIFMHSSSDE